MASVCLSLKCATWKKIGRLSSGTHTQAHTLYRTPLSVCKVKWQQAQWLWLSSRLSARSSSSTWGPGPAPWPMDYLEHKNHGQSWRDTFASCQARKQQCGSRFFGCCCCGRKSESELLKTIANDADNCSSERGVDKERGKGARFTFEWFLMSLSQAPHNLPVIKCGTRLTGQNKSNWVNRRWRGGEGQGGPRWQCKLCYAMNWAALAGPRKCQLKS